MSTRYFAQVTRYRYHPDGTQDADDILFLEDVAAYELAPAMKQLAKKIHESPPPVALEGQASFL